MSLRGDNGIRCKMTDGETASTTFLVRFDGDDDNASSDKSMTLSRFSSKIIRHKYTSNP